MLALVIKKRRQYAGQDKTDNQGRIEVTQCFSQVGLR